MNDFKYKIHHGTKVIITGYTGNDQGGSLWWHLRRIITGYTGNGGNVTVPDTIDGLPVTTIGDEAFVGCTGLTSITLPNSVTTIGGRAFDGCTGLTSIILPNNLTTTGTSAIE